MSIENQCENPNHSSVNTLPIDDDFSKNTQISSKRKTTILVISLIFLPICIMLLFVFITRTDKTTYIDNTPTTSSKGLEFRLNDDEQSYTVTGIGYCEDENIIIDTYNNLPVTHVDNHCFEDCTIKSISLGDSVKYIGVCAFLSCKDLEHVTIPDGIETIRDSAFAHCTNLKYNEYQDGYYLGNDNSPYIIFMKPMRDVLRSISIHKSTRFIYGQAFYEYRKILNVVLGNNVEHIGSSAFEYSGIKTIVIPDSVKTIGSYAFAWTGLEEITLGKNVTALESGVFSSCNLQTLTIPDSVEYIDCYAFDRCHSLNNIVISDNNQHYKIVDGNILSKDGKTFVLFVKSNNSKVFSVPEEVTTIEDNAFRERLTVAEVILPDTVETIGDSAFYYCTNLTSIKLSENLKSMGHHVFYHCTNLTNIEIPDGVEKLEESAFWDCTNLQTITLGKGIKVITAGAFSDCPVLTTVYYKGTQKEWNKINIGTNDCLKNATIIFTN